MHEPDKHLVLDVSAVLDLWLDEDVATNHVTRLLEIAGTGSARLWVTATILNTLDYVAVSRFKQAGIPPSDARQAVTQLIAALLERVAVLSCFGFEQQSLYQSAGDFEDAQIASSARVLKGGQVRIVSLDEEFDALGEIPVLTPEQALAWIERGPEPIHAVIPFVDLALQQTRLRL